MTDLNYGDLKFFGEPDSSFESLGVAALAKRKSEASRYLKNFNRKNLSGLQTNTGLNRLVLLGGQKYILAVEKGIVVHKPYQKYLNDLTKDFKIPKKLLNDIKKLEGLPGMPTTQQVPYGKPDSKGVRKTRTVTAKTVLQPGTADRFEQWYKSFINSQKGEQAFFRKLGKAFEEADLVDAAIPGKKSTDVDISHTYPRSKGGRFTFLEAWFGNQARGARDFIPERVLQEAGLPITYEDLFNAWQLQESGQYSSLGNLGAINPDDIFALARKEDVNQVFKRREDINNILELSEADPNTNIPKFSERYKELQHAARGGVVDPIDGINDTSMFVDLAEDLGYRVDDKGKYRRVNPSRITKTRHRTGIPDLDDYDSIDTGGWGKKALGTSIAGGLTIKGLAGEAGFAAANRQTGKELGILASGEGDMSNVTGAVKGIGQDLVGGGITTGGLKGAQFGWKKAMQLAGKRGATHFAGKGAAGKWAARAVPYAGTALLAYSLYDTADAFTEGLTGKGLNKRIGETYQRIIDEEFDPNRKWTDRHSKEEQDIANLTTM
tara:strand:- start:46 stop:1695 length:1650 start_codon:yes stop_codon:yes gene_type:complete